MKRLAVVSGIVVVSLVASVARAKDPLITDRPDFTESTFVVGRGTVQLEGGATYGDFGSESITTLPDFQLDVRAARRLGSEGVDVLIGIGASARF